MACSRKPEHGRGRRLAAERARRGGFRHVGWLLVVFGLFGLVALPGCRPRKERPDEPAESPRIVSLSPNTTETLYAIGAGAALVGRSRYCDFPDEVRKLPQVGGYVDPNLEAILALRPTLVTGARGPSGTAVTSKLDARGVGTFFPPTESFSEIDAMILGLGERTGHEPGAREVVTRIHERLAALDRALEKAPRVRVLMVFGLDPLSVAGPLSFVDEMLRHAHADNVVTQGGTYPTLGVERVLALDPDVVINASMAESYGKPRIDKDTPGWANVRAVREGRVASLDDESLLRPGPRIARGVSILAHAVHPDVVLPEETP